MIKDQVSGTASTPNYGKLSIKGRIIKRLRNTIANKIQNTFLQFRLYPSYWHYYFSNSKSNQQIILSKQELYLTQKPDYGAGIGHQLANWNSGLYFANYFGLKFAHTPFSSPKWENFFGFNEEEVLAKDLIASPEYKKVRLPRFDSSIGEEVELVKQIVNSYAGQKVLFLFEINQGYARQGDTSKILSEKFFRAKERKNDKLIFENGSYNIALHIRRRMAIENDDMWKDRGLDNIYFANVLKSVLSKLNTEKKVNIYLFSQGKEDEFPEFTEFGNLHFCMEMNPYDSFLHMVYADLLISSKSSFSYKPALISRGIKICPESFWHVYPDSADYILANNLGVFDLGKLDLSKV